MVINGNTVYEPTMRLLLTIAFLFASFAVSAYACGNGYKCAVSDGREYYIRMPKGHDGKTPVGALFFAHGLGGSGKGIANNRELVNMASRLGIALVALQTKSFDWNVKNSPRGRSDRSSNEFTYLDDVIADIKKRFSIDRSKLVLGGMSVGGTFTWTMACTGRNRFAAYMPISGAYWKTPPQSCSTRPQNVIHIHGKHDQIVPLTGRNFSNSGHANIFDIHKAYEKIGGYEERSRSNPVDLNCKISRNGSNKLLELCIHGGEHFFHARHISYVWKRFVELGIL